MNGPGLKIALTSIVAGLALSIGAATAPKEDPQATIISLDDIERDSVRVKPRGETGAEIRFLLLDKNAREIRASLVRLKLRRVRIMDGNSVITEVRFVSIFAHTIMGKERTGLTLLFDSVDEASKVAATLRPYLK